MRHRRRVIRRWVLIIACVLCVIKMIPVVMQSREIKKIPYLYNWLQKAEDMYQSSGLNQMILALKEKWTNTEFTLPTKPETETEPIPVQDTSVGEEDLIVRYIDVGQGSSTLIIQGDETMLIDTGRREAYDEVCAALAEYDIRQLDYLMVSHMDADHMETAADVIEDYSVNSLITADNFSKDTKCVQQPSEARESVSTVMMPRAGSVIPFGDAEIKILAPAKNLDGAYEDSNEYSLVAKLTYKDTSFLFTGDATGKEFRESLDSEGVSRGDYEADVVQLMHHGSAQKDSNSRAFLETVSPYWAVISCGMDNEYGHPHQEVMENLKAMNIQIFRTDMQGSVTARSDGTSIYWDQTSCSDYTSGGGDE